MAPIIAGSEIVWYPQGRCPVWCRGGHDVPVGGSHWGDFHDMELLLHGAAGAANGHRAPDKVLTVLEQGEREMRPKVRQYTASGRDCMVLTLDEAEYLGMTLLRLVAEAKKSMADGLPH